MVGDYVGLSEGGNVSPSNRTENLIIVSLPFCCTSLMCEILMPVPEIEPPWYDAVEGKTFGFDDNSSPGRKMWPASPRLLPRSRPYDPSAWTTLTLVQNK